MPQDFPSPLRAHLLLEGEQLAVLECSVAGLSLAWPAHHSPALPVRRGEDRPAVLVLSGPGPEQRHDVTVRLAAHGPTHVELAFVALPPSVREELERVGPMRAGPGERPFGPGLGGAEAPLPRRLMLHLSATVAEVTRRRRPPGARTPLAATPDAAGTPIGIGLLLVVVAGVMALAALVGALLFR